MKMKSCLAIVLTLLSPSLVASPDCENPTEKNAVSADQVALATKFHSFKAAKEAIKGVQEGKMIDFKKSHASLRGNKELILLALRTYPTEAQDRAWRSNCHDIRVKYVPILEFASKALRSDKEVVMEAVKTRYLQVDSNYEGDVLKHADAKLRDDKEVAAAAVNADFRSLKFLSKRLQTEKDIVALAVKNWQGSRLYGTFSDRPTLELLSGP